MGKMVINHSFYSIEEAQKITEIFNDVNVGILLNNNVLFHMDIELDRDLDHM